MSFIIDRLTARDVRFQLKPGEGADAVHTQPQYAYAVTLLNGNDRLTGTGMVLTMGPGTDLVCSAIEALAQPFVGQDIEQLMANFGQAFRAAADHQHLRWLGPHKGVVHLALASITNACFDLWAKARGVPLWRLLLDLTPEQVVRLLDLSYLEDVLGPKDALEILNEQMTTRQTREDVLTRGYPGYDTSIGWFSYGDEQVMENAKKAIDAGFVAMKLKVGSADSERDIRRARMLRRVVGPHVKVMLDANQQWNLPQAIQICLQLSELPFARTMIQRVRPKTWRGQLRRGGSSLAKVRLAKRISHGYAALAFLARLGRRGAAGHARFWDALFESSFLRMGVPICHSSSTG